MNPKIKNLLKYLYFFIQQLIKFFSQWIFLFIAFVTEPPKTIPPIEENSVIMYSLTELSTMIREKKISSENVVKAYIKRIKQIQPILNCLVEDHFNKALKQARECDVILNLCDTIMIDVLARVKPFFGVPFTAKECIAIEDLKQTAGLVSRKNFQASKDATVIKLLKEAGAILIATTNVSELVIWWETSNYVYETTRNPYNTRYIVGGSFGGEGCLQSAAGSCFGVSSDIIGSTRTSCFFNGIFGHKPSTGIVSNDGQFPPCVTEDLKHLIATGPMCRYATDLKPILRVLADDNISKLKLDTKVDISKLKFYYMEDDGGKFLISPVSSEIKHAMNRVILHLKKTHNVYVEKVNIEKMKNSFAISFAHLVAPKDVKMAFGMNINGEYINFWLEFLKWATFSGQHTFITFFTELFATFGLQCDNEKRNKLLQDSRDLYKEFHDMLGEDGVFLYPTYPTNAPLHNEPLLKPINFTYTSIMNCLGLPATACPLGLSNDLPIGIQIVADQYQDHLTLAVAEELERKFGGWVPPRMQNPTSDTKLIDVNVE